MGKSNAVLLALGTFLGVVGRKSRLVVNHCLRTVHHGIAQMGRTVLYHLSSAFWSAGLKISRLHSGKGKQFGWIVELGKITKFRKNNCGRSCTDSRNGQYRRSKGKDTVMNLQLNFLHLALKLVVNIDGDLHFLKQIVAGWTDRISGQRLEFNKIHHGESSSR